MIEVIDTGLVPSKGPVSGMVRAGGTVYTAQIPKDPVTGEIVKGDIEVQARRTFANLKQSVEAAGGTLKDVAQVQIFLVEASDAAVMNKVYQEFFTAPYPNRATVVVKALLAPGMLIELVAYAHIG
ncbi:MAG: RidA family protein [Alphaproteobacteria bacterium]